MAAFLDFDLVLSGQGDSWLVSLGRFLLSWLGF